MSELTSALRKTTTPPSPIQEVAPFEIEIENSVKRGSHTARIAVVEFADFECPFCGRYAQTAYRDVRRQFIDSGKVQYVFRHLPLEHLHPSAKRAAYAAECAREQGKFWEMHERLFDNQGALTLGDLQGHAQALAMDVRAFTGCLSSPGPAARVDADLAEAKRLNLTGTPAFLIGELTDAGYVRVKKQIIGARPFSAFQEALEDMF